MKRHTAQIRPLMHYIGAGHPLSGKQAPEVQGYEVEFFRAGEFVERRGYAYGADEKIMFTRVTNWVRDGAL